MNSYLIRWQSRYVYDLRIKRSTWLALLTDFATCVENFISLHIQAPKSFSSTVSCKTLPFDEVRDMTVTASFEVHNLALVYVKAELPLAFPFSWRVKISFVETLFCMIRVFCREFSLFWSFDYSSCEAELVLITLRSNDKASSKLVKYDSYIQYFMRWSSDHSTFLTVREFLN